MKILAMEKDVPDVRDNMFTEELLSAEAARVWVLYQTGVIRELYFRSDREAAVLVLECPSPEDATRVLATLPLVERNLIHFEVVPLRSYPGFERLFQRRK